MDNEEGLRLQVYMARCGIGSRRKCEEYIADGRVKVDGRTMMKKGCRITDEKVSFDGRNIYPVTEMKYFALNKPTGYLCTSSDPEGRPLALDLLKDVYSGRLYNVGRLDFMSSGLIFFTNDGNFTKKVSHPSAQIEKEYVVETKEKIEKEFLEACKKGIIVKGVNYKIDRWEYKTPFKVKLILVEGKNREIRNLFMSQNMKIKKLHRIRIGGVRITGIPTGQYRFLTKKEIDSLVKGRNH
ncbi:MAG: rRNA pseudouridine synthase [Spirochaetales bacterium]|nr:rRNA pseudouridine synthase [Spirochaetales bacterium]